MDSSDQNLRQFKLGQNQEVGDAGMLHFNRVKHWVRLLVSIKPIALFIVLLHEAGSGRELSG